MVMNYIKAFLNILNNYLADLVSLNRAAGIKCMVSLYLAVSSECVQRVTYFHYYLYLVT